MATLSTGQVSSCSKPHFFSDYNFHPHSYLLSFAQSDSYPKFAYLAAPRKLNNGLFFVSFQRSSDTEVRL